MHIVITLLVFVGLAAIIVWVADWVSVGRQQRATAIDILNRRLARGEIDREEYDEKRRVLGTIGHETEKIRDANRARRIAANIAKLPDVSD